MLDFILFHAFSGLVESFSLFFFFFLNFVLDEVEKVVPERSVSLLLEFLFPDEMPFGGEEHVLELGEGEFVEVLFRFSHESIQLWVVGVLALVDVEDFDELIDGFLAGLLDSEEGPEDLLVLVELLLLLEVLVIVQFPCV